MKRLVNYNNKYAKFFFEEDDLGDASSSSAVDLLDGGDDTQDPDPTPEPQSKPAAFDPDAVAQSLGKFFVDQGFVPNRVDTQPKQPTREEVLKQLKHWEPDDAFIAEFNNMETQGAALKKLVSNIYNHVYALSAGLQQDFTGALDQRLTPLQEHFQTQQEQARAERFTKTYPTLKDERYAPVIAAVINSFKASKQTFKSEAEGFAALAKGVESVIQAAGNPGFKLEAAVASATNKRGSAASPLPNQSSGSGAGGGASKGSGGGGSGKPKAVQLLGP